MYRLVDLTGIDPIALNAFLIFLVPNEITYLHGVAGVLRAG